MPLRVWTIQVSDESGIRHASSYTDERKAKEHMKAALREIARKMLGAAAEMERWGEPFTAIVRKQMEDLATGALDITNLLNQENLWSAYETWLVFEAESEGVYNPPIRAFTGSLRVDVR